MLYIPESFREDDASKLHDFIRRHSFATLVSSHADDAPSVTHLPLLLEVSEGSAALVRCKHERI